MTRHFSPSLVVLGWLAGAALGAGCEPQPAQAPDAVAPSSQELVHVTESFESGLANWVISGTVTTSSGATPNPSGLGLRLAGIATATRALSTTGYTANSLRYQRRTVGYDTGLFGTDTFYVETSTDNINWTQHYAARDANWASASHVLGASYDDRATLYVRLRTVASSSLEYAEVDDLVLDGTATCVPSTCAAYPGQCGAALSNGCGGTIDCSAACTGGQTCDATSGTCTGTCVPATCQVGQCGSVSDGCGGNLACGTCPGGDPCVANQCCQPASCVPGQCGNFSNGCGGSLSCGCAQGESCQNGHCACQPLTQCPPTARCGSIPDGCGGTLVCADQCAPLGQSCDVVARSCVACSPTSCAVQGAECGQISNGCGGSLSCGSCGAGEQCSGANQCLACTPASCQGVGAECGVISNGCGGSQNCGNCAANEFCDRNSQCQACAPTTCLAQGASCGALDNGCGGSLDCGDCGSGEVCTDNQCDPACTPLTCNDLGATCGTISDGCAGLISCGGCAANETCGPNHQCVSCSPTSCQGSGAECGFVANGCDGVLDCGYCGAGEACLGFACQACTPQTTCASAGAQCGEIVDNCGNHLDCGSCPGASDQCTTANQCVPSGCPSCTRLSLADLDTLDTFLSCRATCDAGAQAARVTCLAACPAQAPAWDKNLDGAVDDVDLRLAYLEYWDDGTGNAICYEGGAVVPAPACGLGDCLAQFPNAPAQCADVDGDGLRAWQEALIGTSDRSSNSSCQIGSECGYYEQCQFVDAVNRKLCVPRACPAGQCTAFHLEEIESDNSEVILHLHYDYSPVPATVLDLYVDYDSDVMTLAEARPLTSLKNAGKPIQVRHNSSGQLRLIVFDPGSSLPIPTGAIVELVFARTGTGPARIGFSTVDFAQQWSIAPSQGLATADLSNDALWGTPITVPDRGPNGDRLLLHYSFDNANRPLDVKDAMSGDELCSLEADCANIDTTTAVGQRLQNRLIAQYDALQQGTARYSKSLPGVSGTAAFLDGTSDRLELPITLNSPATGQPYQRADQGFTLSTWLFNEGNGLRSASTNGEVLFSHNNQSSELTAYGVLARQRPGDLFDLVFFEGNDITSATLTTRTIASNLPNRSWLHFGMAVDGATRVVTFYLDGQPASGLPTTTLTGPVDTCPGFEPPPGAGLDLHDEGDLQFGGQSPDKILFSAAKNNLYGIEEMDVSGLSRRDRIRLPDAQARDPHYHAELDKLAFASSNGGNFEIWIADGDGSSPQRITSGFGDTARGIFARRPRWAPDGSGIVFESNVYDILAGDNAYSRTYRLFYIAYDNLANQVAIPSGASTITELNYPDLLANQTVDQYSLTHTPSLNHYDVQWLRGSVSGQDRGVILMSTASQRYDTRAIAGLEIPLTITPTTNPTALPMWATPLTDNSQLRLLAAALPAGTSAGSANLAALLQSSNELIARERIDYPAHPDFTVASVNLGNGDFEAVITYNPAPMVASCWDLNRNGFQDPTEDVNADNAFNTLDCHPSTVTDLYLEYDDAQLTPQVDLRGVIAIPGAFLVASAKELFADFKQSSVTGSARSFVKVDVRSPANGLPIPPGTVIGRIAFFGSSGASLSDRQRLVDQTLHIKLGSADPLAWNLPANTLDLVQDAAFSPDADRLVLSGIENARPVVVTTADVMGGGLQKISDDPVRAETMHWTKITRSYPCNWIGNFRNPFSKLYQGSFRGALDELKLYSYVRNPGAFQSEAERGFEWLQKTGLGGQGAPQNTPCTTHLDCPRYQVCDIPNGQCFTDSCDPTAEYPCGIAGACNLLPVPAGGDDTLQWVCSVDCASDTQCFQQECLNGPCRFCDPATNSCNECRDDVLSIPGLSPVPVIVGCPDRNAFSCFEGSCITECYTSDNGQSIYLCDPALEYCRQGRCELFEWSWEDFAPATFSGLGQMAIADPNWNPGNPTPDTTMHPLMIATPQIYPIEIEAWGLEDQSHPPMLRVQGRFPAVRGSAAGNAPGQWFEIGRVSVHNRNNVEAANNKYLLNTPYPVSELRLSMVVTPYDNLNNAASGYGANMCDFAGTPNAVACYTRASGSYATIGYPVGLPARVSRRDCAEELAADPAWLTRLDPTGGLRCESTADDAGAEYLPEGHPGVVVKSVTVNGNAAATLVNRICSYEGTATPLEAGANLLNLDLAPANLLPPSGGSLSVVPSSAAAQYQGGSSVLWAGAPRDARIEIAFTVTQPGEHQFFARFGTGPDVGRVEASVVPQPAGAPIVLQRAIELLTPQAGVRASEYVLGRTVLPAGNYRLRFTLTGARPDSTGNALYLDTLRVLKPVRQRQMWFGRPQEEQSNKRTAFYAGQTDAQALRAYRANPAGGAPLQNDFDPTFFGTGLLNCNYVAPNGAEAAELVLDVNTLFAYPGGPLVSSIKETANGCFVTRGNRTEPCYESVGADTRLDYMNHERVLNRTVEYEQFSSFGYDFRSGDYDHGCGYTPAVGWSMQPGATQQLGPCP